MLRYGSQRTLVQWLAERVVCLLIDLHFASDWRWPMEAAARLIMRFDLLGGSDA